MEHGNPHGLGHNLRSDFQGPPGAHQAPRDVQCSSHCWTLPPAEPFPRWAANIKYNPTFANRPHSSHSWNRSRHVCSHLNPSQKIKVNWSSRLVEKLVARCYRALDYD
ncbi:unnamed protein product [Cuscuta epithymum]|uniref:Uncharacterized protein n=1 Tax=Cuscuta epithymum TaxID=186058 RepID=A0AAV0FJP4_9ASTE|nr:unnamed protein product [Cuscuta epithymum]